MAVNKDMYRTIDWFATSLMHVGQVLFLVNVCNSASREAASTAEEVHRLQMLDVENETFENVKRIYIKFIFIFFGFFLVDNFLNATFT